MPQDKGVLFDDKALLSEDADESEAAANDAQAARQEAKAKTAIQNDKDDVVTGLMNQLAAYVESIAGGDEAIIRSAGMDTKTAASSPTENPDASANLNVPVVTTSLL